MLERLEADLRTVDDIYPLSPMQQGILFHSLYAPDRSTYVNQLVATLTSPDIARVTDAFNRIVPQHDILRSECEYDRLLVVPGPFVCELECRTRVGNGDLEPAVSVANHAP